MKKIFSLQLCVCLFLTMLFSQCSTIDVEVIEIDKKTVMQHNYIAIATKDDAPGEVEVRYTILGKNGENEVKTEKLSTPCVIGGENIIVTYDSLHTIYSCSKEFIDFYLDFKRDYQENGADFLLIRNLSNSTLEYAVIGNQPLVFYEPKRLEGFQLTNKDVIDQNKVVKDSPTPIYLTGVPVLYLLKPELAKFNDYYIPLSIGECKGNGAEMAISNYAKKINIKSSINPTGNVREIINLYKDEYSYGQTLFENYPDYNRKCPEYKGLAARKKFYNKEMKLYGEIQPNGFLKNSGQIWFINASDMSGNDTFRSSRWGE